MAGSTEHVDVEVRDVPFRERRALHRESAIRSHLLGSQGPGVTAAVIGIPTTGKPLCDIEYEAIAVTMALTGNNQSAAARILRISRPTLSRKLRELGIRRENLQRLDVRQV